MGTLGRRLIVGMRAGAGVMILAGWWSLYAAMSAPSASASTLGGTATITDPVSNDPLSNGGSETMFTVVLTPAPADCSGDTAKDGYEVYSYLVPQGTDVTTISFAGGTPSTGWGLVDGSGLFDAISTAPNTGEIINIPADFEWADLLSLGETVSDLESKGTWEAGIACATSAGVVSDYWNTQVTFTANDGDPHGFVWSAVPGTGTTTTTTTSPSSTTTSPSSTTTSPSSTTTSPGSSTTLPGSTTTSPGSTSSGNATSTTAAATAASSGSSGGDGSGVTAASGSSLAFTGAWITRGLAVGMLFIGFGLILLGLSVKVRRDITPRVALR